ncbi:hypothetical protein OIU85_018328 [Salix viminalis]|uniref:Uncharacterized protein n=1 Tax=Salix viminalis TaxID=40686 RepID=A0A9Q0ZIW0_SALVM|nr:hypothetical protein OIU85_018328 [Salix viminalis]
MGLGGGGDDVEVPSIKNREKLRQGFCYWVPITCGSDHKNFHTGGCLSELPQLWFLPLDLCDLMNHILLLAQPSKPKCIASEPAATQAMQGDISCFSLYQYSQAVSHSNVFLSSPLLYQDHPPAHMIRAVLAVIASGQCYLEDLNGNSVKFCYNHLPINDPVMIWRR